MPRFLTTAVAVLFAIPMVSAAGDDPANSSNTPDWVKEKTPSWVQPYLGKAGLPPPWNKIKGPLGSAVKGIDRWQANHFVVYRKETAKFLDKDYTPLPIDYRPGTLPSYEKVVAKYTSTEQSDRKKAVALLTKAMPDIMLHPTIPPLGKAVRPDRNLLDEPLLASECGWCNEQARVFVRLCQVAGIPARMIFLFYADGRSGHVVAEFYADGHWSMADSSWFCVFRDETGKLLSAAELHNTAAGKKLASQVYRARFQEIAKLPDEQLTGGRRDAAKLRKSLMSQTPSELGSFGVLNYPLFSK